LTIQDALTYGCDLLSSELAQLDSEVLLANTLRKSRTYLKTWPERCVPHHPLRQYFQLLQRRSNGEPIAYLMGEREFWSLKLSVDCHTLIPRPETEHLVEAALEKIPADGALKILDLGTGTGAIAIAIALERPMCSITAIDTSKNALVIALKNAQKHRLHNLQYRQSDWFEQVQEVYDVIVSNPPYIRTDDPHLERGDVRFEPRLALVSGQDGMTDLRKIIRNASDYLRPGGFLMLEHGFDQQTKVIHTLTKHGYVQIQGLQDYQGNARLVVAQTLSDVAS